mmetsp:Transcript_61751/g.169703  ORF Transcript_61751/g.169703 Transcript_61751/m.169703 type:complete len:215 (+) Transcript_61751:292-936(+)
MPGAGCSIWLRIAPTIAPSTPLCAACSRLSKLSPTHRLISAAHACCCTAGSFVWPVMVLQTTATASCWSHTLQASSCRHSMRICFHATAISCTSPENSAFCIVRITARESIDWIFSGVIFGSQRLLGCSFLGPVLGRSTTLAASSASTGTAAVASSASRHAASLRHTSRTRLSAALLLLAQALEEGEDEANRILQLLRDLVFRNTKRCQELHKL